MKTKEILLLWKIQLLGFFGANQAAKTKSKKEKKKARSFLVTAIVSVLVLVYLSTQYSIIMASTLSSTGMIDLLPQVMFTACCMLVLFTTIIKAAPTLFGAGDTDLLMSLPVKTSSIIASRVLVLFSMDFFYTASFLLPMGVVYAVFANESTIGMVMFAVMFFFAAFVPGVVACIFAVLFAWISSFFKSTTSVKNIFSMLFMLAFLGISFTFNGSNPEKMVDISSSIVGVASKVYPLTGFFGKAMCEGDVLSFVIFVAVSIAVFAAFCLVVGKNFKRLFSLVNSKHTGAKFEMSELKANSQFGAMYKKELKRFFSSNIYFMNCGIGSIMMLVIAVALIIVLRGGFIETAGEGLAAIIINVLPFILAWGANMCCPSACSISLEGKNFWLLRSLPIKAKNVLLAKVAMSLTITAVPSFVSSLAMNIALKMGIAQRIALMIIPLLFCIFSALLGLRVNLRFPSMDWKNEAEPIKQSTASFIATLGFMPLSIIPAILVSALSGYYTIVITAVGAVLVLVSLLIYRNLDKNGERLLAAVQE